MSCWIHKIDLPLQEDDKRKWKPYPIYKGKTKILDFLSCHVSILSPGHSPHLPHSHEEEEILIVLDGEAELVISDNESIEDANIYKLTRGYFIYYPAWQFHTIRNISNSPVTYLMFKWRNLKNNNNELPTTIFKYEDSFNESNKLFVTKRLFEYNTLHLEKLHCHLTSMKPGGGYKSHKDKHDVAILTLSGKVKTLGKIVEPYSVIFYPAGKKHGLRNIHDERAFYLVFEFHCLNKYQHNKFIKFLIKNTLNR